MIYQALGYLGLGTETRSKQSTKKCRVVKLSEIQRVELGKVCRLRVFRRGKKISLGNISIYRRIEGREDCGGDRLKEEPMYVIS